GVSLRSHCSLIFFVQGGSVSLIKSVGISLSISVISEGLVGLPDSGVNSSRIEVTGVGSPEAIFIYPLRPSGLTCHHQRLSLLSSYLLIPQFVSSIHLVSQKFLHCLECKSTALLTIIGHKGINTLTCHLIRKLLNHGSIAIVFIGYPLYRGQRIIRHFNGRS